jgi:cysteine desulfurase/selenocysteine lyase
VGCPNGRVLVDDLINACDSKTRVLSVSSVQFSNGYRVDLSTLGEACRSRNIMLVVDANHTVGAFAFQVKDLPIDAMATQSFKWLCGPYNTGWLYIRKELIESIRPSAVGPLSALPSESFLDTRFCLRTDAGRFETGVLNFAGIIGAGVSLRYFKSIRMDVIENRVIHLTDYRLANEGIVISMREGALRISPHFYNTEEEVDELLAALP